jgi:hypothetical protein
MNYLYYITKGLNDPVKTTSLIIKTSSIICSFGDILNGGYENHQSWIK